MVAEVLEHLAPGRSGVFVDCTVGLGGHTRAMLEGGASRVIGLDRDRDALAEAGAALLPYGDRVELVHTDYRRLEEVLEARGLTEVDGVLADLGVSSIQLDAPGRGFSFRRDEPLDMRMDATAGPTAAEAIGEADERTLADVIYEFGEERHARRIARGIVAARARGPIDTTGRLADVVRRANPPEGIRADRSGDADVPGAPHLGEPRTGGTRRVSGSVGPPVAPRRADGGDHVPFAGGPDRETHVAGAADRRRCRCDGSDEATGRAGRGGSRTQSPRPQREVAGGGTDRPRGPFGW